MTVICALQCKQNNAKILKVIFDAKKGEKVSGRKKERKLSRVGRVAGRKRRREECLGR